MYVKSCDKAHLKIYTSTYTHKYCFSGQFPGDLFLLYVEGLALKKLQDGSLTEMVSSSLEDGHSSSTCTFTPTLALTLDRGVLLEYSKLRGLGALGVNSGQRAYVG
jgi:hypothetical protein